MKAGVLVIVGFWCLAGCTKVREQPAAAPQVTPPPLPVVARPRAPVKRPSFSNWPSSGAVANNVAPAPPAAAPAAPAPATLNGDPNGLKQPDLQRALDGVLPSLASCFDGPGAQPAGGVGLTFEADPSGHARDVKVTGASAQAQRCVSSVVSGVRLPEFSGKSVPVQFPLSIHRPSPATPPPATATAPAAPAAPPVFVNP